jgi:hypothetical protein
VPFGWHFPNKNRQNPEISGFWRFLGRKYQETTLGQCRGLAFLGKNALIYRKKGHLHA